MFEQDLSIFNDAFATVSPKKEWPELPDGQHTGQVIAVILTTTKTTGKPMIIFEFITSEPEVKIYINSVLSLNSIPYIRANLVVLDFPTQGKFSENLEIFCDSFLMPKTITLRKKTITGKNGSEYANYTFFKVETKSTEVIVSEEPDEIPF